MKDWLEIAGVALLVLLMVVVGIACVLLVVALYGAILGALGAGAVVAFKWLVALAGF